MREESGYPWNVVVNRHDISENEVLPIPSKMRMSSEVRASTEGKREVGRWNAYEGIASNAISEDSNSYTKVWKNENFTEHI